MRYIFSGFEFNSTSLVLTKNGQALSIRHNEAKVLAALLEDTDKVLSKEDILSAVWQDKVVSEQAVFQNISHLRNIFGNEAIKTFAKRGYQWQIKAKAISSATQSSVTPINTSVQANLAKKDQVKTSHWLIGALVSVIIGMFAVLNYTGESINETTDNKIEIAYIPFTNAQDNSVLNFEDNHTFNFSKITHLDTAQFEVVAELEYPNLVNTHPLILTGQIRVHQQQFYLDFLLKGPFADWSGQLSGISKDDVIKQLHVHLQQSFIYDILSNPQAPELKQANLSIAHQKSPDDLINLDKLINIYIEMTEFEKAIVLAEKLADLATKQKKPQHVGNALLFQSKLLTQKELYDLSAHKLTSAIEQFEKIADLKRQADAWFAHSWLDHQHEDYPAVKTSLLKSAKLSLSAKDIPRELDALTYLSVMAHKNKQETDKYLYLQLAENKMKEYNLPIYHFAKIPFHYAIFATKQMDKEPHFEQVLEFTKLTPDHWVAQSSRQDLMKHYIKLNRLEDAQVLVDDLKTDTPENSYLKTLLAHAKKQTDIFNQLAQHTFELAQLSGRRYLSLDVALLLCSEPDMLINYDFYSQYIHENSTKHWRRLNKNQLVALNL